MTEKAKLLMGIEDFGEMRSRDYDYIDKTGLIKNFLENPGKACEKRAVSAIRM